MYVCVCHSVYVYVCVRVSEWFSRSPRLTLVCPHTHPTHTPYTTLGCCHVCLSCRTHRTARHATARHRTSRHRRYVTGRHRPAARPTRLCAPCSSCCAASCWWSRPSPHGSSGSDACAAAAWYVAHVHVRQHGACVCVCVCVCVRSHAHWLWLLWSMVLLMPSLVHPPPT